MKSSLVVRLVYAACCVLDARHEEKRFATRTLGIATRVRLLTIDAESDCEPPPAAAWAAAYDAVRNVRRELDAARGRIAYLEEQVAAAEERAQRVNRWSRLKVEC